MGKANNITKKEKYSAQKTITERNRKIKRERHMKNQPNDLQTQAVLNRMQ